jgi:hypothetical protein
MTSRRDRIRNQIRKPIRPSISRKLIGQVTKKKQQREAPLLQGEKPDFATPCPGVVSERACGAFFLYHTHSFERQE